MRRLQAARVINQLALLDHADLSGLLRKACAAHGSAEAFARSLGVSPQYLSAVANGRRQPSATILAALNVRRVIRYQNVGATND